MIAARFKGLGKWPVAGVLVAMICAFTLWDGNVNRVGYEDALPTIAMLLAGAGVFTALIRLRTGGWQRAALITAIWTGYLLYAPRLVEAIFEADWLRWGLLGALALFAWDVSRRVPQRGAELDKTSFWANAVLLALAALPMASVGINQFRTEQRPGGTEAFPAFKGKAGATSPDVWHLIFDRYGNRDTLARVYNYDNRPFLDALRQRGFTVADNAHSNYQRTGHSVSSTLNASYLDALGEGAVDQKKWMPIYRALRDNSAIRFFGDQGYKTVWAGTWWNPTLRNPHASTNLNLRALPELARLVLDDSVVGKVFGALALPYGDARGDQCLREKTKFAQLKSLAGEGGRKYVFGHFLVPHPPFVLNADGSCRSLEAANAATREANYAGQLTYANREILALVDAISAGPRPATIILHADEGPWPKPYVGDERFLGTDPVKVNWKTVADDKLREKMGILLAVRHSDGKASAAHQSPINLYPEVLNRSFSGQMPLKPERHYVFNSSNALYSFTDVTSVVRQREQ